ncbi:MAG: isochorismatase family protein [Waddliaceae bacterium]
MSFSLFRDRVGLLVIDVQDRLVQQVERSCEVLRSIQTVVKGFQALQLPIILTEQYPAGLGETVSPLKAVLEEGQRIFSKTTFSCLGEKTIKDAILCSSQDQWVLVGMEAHICILQTAKDLLAVKKDVVVVNDAMTSRSLYDFSTAIAELRDCGVRISSKETILFELLRDAKAPEFSKIRQLLQ